jgi:hypothetical protein
MPFFQEPERRNVVETAMLHAGGVPACEATLPDGRRRDLACPIFRGEAAG